MKFSQVDAELPTIGRWIRLNRKYPGDSTLRMLEYEALEKVTLSGSVLDIGGGDNSKYRQKLPSDIEYKSVNIDPDINPTWRVEPGQPLPIDDDTFDYSISLNTFEHVYDANSLLKEVHRVLKPGGTLYISVPWIFRIHGHPDDYARRTPSWWKEALEDIGFASCELQPLVWGRYSVGGTITGYRFTLKTIGRHLDHIKDIVYAQVAMRSRSGNYEGRRGQRIYNVAPGHFIVATK